MNEYDTTRKRLSVFDPRFLEGVRLAYGPEVYYNVLDYIEEKDFDFNVENPWGLLISLCNKELAWLNKRTNQNESIQGQRT